MKQSKSRNYFLVQVWVCVAVHKAKKSALTQKVSLYGDSRARIISKGSEHLNWVFLKPERPLNIPPSSAPALHCHRGALSCC
jgi:hypothetical protein